MKDGVGCLKVEDWQARTPVFDELTAALARMGARVLPFAPSGDENRLPDDLREAYSRLEGCGARCIAAAGAGVYGALALAGQLCVDRLLMTDFGLFSNNRPKSVHKLAKFARRNAAFCACDTVVVTSQGQRSSLAEDLRRAAPFCRICELSCAAGALESASSGLVFALATYLIDGDFAKLLAQKSEMCII